MTKQDQAINLLKDPNLIWSADFESIRLPLLALLQQTGQGFVLYGEHMALVQALIAGSPTDD